MSPKNRTSAVQIAFIAAFALCSALTQARADEKFTGRVYDIDYPGRQGWTQTLFQALQENASLVAMTKSDQLQRILEAALLNATEVQVTYRQGQPGEIQSASLRAGVDCSKKGCVEEVRCAIVAGTCKARIVGEKLKVHLKDIRTLGILLTAMNEKKAVESLDVDNQNFIIRVKINVA